MERSKLIVEAAGIAALAAILDNPSHFEGPVVATLSGGNIDPQLLNRVIRSRLSAAGRLMTLQVRLPDRPGALAQLLTVIGESGANVVQVSHTRINPRLDIHDVDVDIELETRGFEHREKILALLNEGGFKVVDSF